MAEAFKNTIEVYLRDLNKYNQIKGATGFKSGAGVLNKLETSGISNKLSIIECDVMLAHLRMLGKRSILSMGEVEKTISALQGLQASLRDGDLKSHVESLELLLDKIDPEHNIQSVLSIEEVKATSLRLWTRDAIDNLMLGLQNLIVCLIDKSEEHVKTLVPEVSNSSISQPTSLGFLLVAFVKMFGQDIERLVELRKRLNVSPVGAFKGCGSAFNVNRDMVAKLLGFNGCMENAHHAITERDYAIEFLSAVSIVSMHITSLVQNFINWNSPFYDFIKFSTRFTDADNISPMRSKSSTLEVIRSSGGVVNGSLMNVITSLQGLDGAFSSDLLQIAEPMMSAQAILCDSLSLLASLTTDMKVNRKNMKEMASYGYSVSQDLVHWLMRNIEVGHLEAVETTQKIVKHASDRGKKLSLLELEELQAIEPKITEDVYSVLIPSRAMVGRRTPGGSNPMQVKKVIRSLRRQYV